MENKNKNDLLKPMFIASCGVQTMTKREVGREVLYSHMGS